MRTPAGATAAILAAIALSITVLDRPISTFSHAVLGRPHWCVLLTTISDVPVPAATVTLGLAGTAWIAGWRPGVMAQAVLAAAIATLLSAEVKDVLKLAFGRPWPEPFVPGAPTWIGTQTFGFFPFHGGRGFMSFPSGHTTVITAPCVALWRVARWARPVLAALPLLVVTGLLGADFHFFGDCVAGGALGMACAFLVVRGWGATPITSA